MRFKIVIVLVLLTLPLAMAVDGPNQQSELLINFETLDTPPFIWMCDHRLLFDDNVNPGTTPGDLLIERTQNYAFEGEMIQWDVLVMDKSGIEKISDVYVTAGYFPGEGNPIEANCRQISDWEPDGKTVIELCQRSEEKTGDCLVGDAPYGQVTYTKHGKKLIVAVDFYQLNPAHTYQFALEGTAGKDGNSNLAVACPSPNTGAVWECGYWPFPQVPSSLGFYNFEMSVAPDSTGQMHETYVTDLPIGHYADIKFLVKDNDNGWYNELTWIDLMEFWIYDSNSISPKCNARIGEEKLTTFNPSTMDWYRCTFTVETPESMYGPYFIGAEVEDINGSQTAVDEQEYWFFNPQMAVTVDGTVEFGTVTPGTVAYSDSVIIGFDVAASDEDAGLMMEMFIAGTDFYDPASSGAKCPYTNQLNLDNFNYYAVKGAGSSETMSCSDFEGYMSIPHGSMITQAKEILGCDMYSFGIRNEENVLTYGSEMTLTFKLELPEPCIGDFSSGHIYFWGEAI
ncbi:MAG: hypothetical protein ABIF10_02470 [Candidatus Woesearchaeota archaeon]